MLIRPLCLGFSLASTGELSLVPGLEFDLELGLLDWGVAPRGYL